MKKSVKNQNYLFIFVSAVVIELVLTLYLKLKMNGLGWSDFNIFYLGNLFNIFLSFSLIIGIFIIYFYRKALRLFEKNVIIILSITLLIPVLVVLIIEEFNITFPAGFIFYYPVQKVYIAILFILGESIKIFSFFIVWFLIYSFREFSYLNSLFYSVASVILLVLFSFFYTTGSITKINELKENGEYDVGVILGAAVWSKNKPSPIFKQRIDKAYELYKSGKIKKILVTGGNAPGEISEAQAAENYLVELGIEKKNILLESFTSTTSEQIRFIKNSLIKQQGMSKILIVSDQFHLKRVLEMCKFFNVKADGIESGYKLNWKKLLYYRVRDSIGLLLFWLFAI